MTQQRPCLQVLKTVKCQTVCRAASRLIAEMRCIHNPLIDINAQRRCRRQHYIGVELIHGWCWNLNLCALERTK